MPNVDQDCNTEFPHRSAIVINQKKYDEYCMKIKSCAEWTDTLKDDNNNPVPWPSECKPNTFKKLPIIYRGRICESIKKSIGSFEDISENLVDFKLLFKDISDNYVDKYATWMKYPSDDNKQKVDTLADSWENLKRDLIKERTRINTISHEYTTRVKGVSQILINDRTEHDKTTGRLKDAKKRLQSMGGKDMKMNMYNATSGHIVQTIYYTTAIIVMGIFLRKLN
jgi:hypothetical protein|tara:strand:- start:2083 stop:2757 length:675 start_codon:yes stop_codon:yes gene_type:complete